MTAGKYFLAILLAVAVVPAEAASLQSDCRGLGNIGTATMAPDGTITMMVRSPDGAEGALAYKKGDPDYARVFSHIGGIKPGEKKPVPAFCGS